MNIDLRWLLDTDYTEPLNFLLITSILFVVIFGRYLLLALLYHLFFYKKLGQLQPYRRLHEQIKMPQVKMEIGYSLAVSVIFALSGTAMLITWQKGYTQIYTQLGWWEVLWVPLSIVIAMFLHETYYYWLHRWMHNPKILHHFHHIHHNSVFTSSFTSFSFHPLEAVLQAIFLPVLVLILPIHVFVLVSLLLIMSISAVINHAGVEVFPPGLMRSRIGRWFIGATHHDMHHLKFRCNYGLYFTFWDVWMRTEDSRFEKRFTEYSQKAN